MNLSWILNVSAFIVFMIVVMGGKQNDFSVSLVSLHFIMLSLVFIHNYFYK